MCYKDECDTCDSKNDKTPVMCACAYARRQVIIVILQFVFLQISNLFPTVVLWKTTRCFTRNNTLFYEKRHVVLRETTRCFMRNDTLFYDEWHVVLLRKCLHFFPIVREDTMSAKCSDQRPFVSLLRMAFLKHNASKRTFPRTKNKEIADIFLCLREK